MISYCEQDCVVILVPFPNNRNPVQSFNVKTDFDLQGDGLDQVWCGMHALNSCSTVPCVPQAPSGSGDSHKEVSLVYFSTFEPIELTPDSPCSMIQPATCACPASTSALWPTYLGPSFRAS